MFFIILHFLCSYYHYRYTQVIALKGELLELQEKQAREPVIMNVDNVFGEIEKQVKVGFGNKRFVSQVP